MRWVCERDVIIVRQEAWEQGGLVWPFLNDPLSWELTVCEDHINRFQGQLVSVTYQHQVFISLWLCCLWAPPDWTRASNMYSPRDTPKWNSSSALTESLTHHLGAALPLPSIWWHSENVLSTNQKMGSSDTKPLSVSISDLFGLSNLKEIKIYHS